MSNSTFDVLGFNRGNYQAVWNDLNRNLRAVEEAHGLQTALVYLEKQQLDQGFIQDDLKEVERYRLIEPGNAHHAFTAQFNPRRALRREGAGRRTPPHGTTSVNFGCFLCKDNIRWQQRGVELGYDIEVGDRGYIAWMNPFPLMSTHATIAAADHRPQTWIVDDVQKTEKNIGVILGDLLELARRLPGFMGFYNGAGAGASIPEHFHFQFFKRPEQEFFLERVARIAIASTFPQPQLRYHPLVLRDYPIKAVYFYGQRNDIVEQAGRWVREWTAFYETTQALSANIIVRASRRRNNDTEQFHLFFIPRNQFFSHAPGMAGLVGGLEVLGEIVLSDQEEKQLLVKGHTQYDTVVRILASVEAPRVAEFFDVVAA
jgi:hypothetical protein